MNNVKVKLFYMEFSFLKSSLNEILFIMGNQMSKSEINNKLILAVENGTEEQV